MRILIIHLHFFLNMKVFATQRNHRHTWLLLPKRWKPQICVSNILSSHLLLFALTFGNMDIVIFRGNIKHKYSSSHAASGFSDPLHPFWYAQRLYQVITLYCDLLSNSTSQSTNNVQNEYKYRAIFFTPEDLLDRFSRNAQATNQGLKLRKKWRTIWNIFLTTYFDSPYGLVKIRHNS